MRDGHASVTRGVGRDDVLECVERIAHGSIADRMDVGIEAEGVDGCHRESQLARLPVGQSVIMGAAAVGLQQGACRRLEHAIREELHGP